LKNGQREEVFEENGSEKRKEHGTAQFVFEHQTETSALTGVLGEKADKKYELN
jgi:hypothetical protein